jgi:hypothetical protein
MKEESKRPEFRSSRPKMAEYDDNDEDDGNITLNTHSGPSLQSYSCLSFSSLSASFDRAQSKIEPEPDSGGPFRPFDSESWQSPLGLKREWIWAFSLKIRCTAEVDWLLYINRVFHRI